MRIASTFSLLAAVATVTVSAAPAAESSGSLSFSGAPSGAAPSGGPPFGGNFTAPSGNFTNPGGPMANATGANFGAGGPSGGNFTNPGGPIMNATGTASSGAASGAPTGGFRSVIASGNEVTAGSYEEAVIASVESSSISSAPSATA
ncbi:hypothetical protein IAR50_007578 [Cryptococcus sp. DSM 104548]